MLEGQWLITSAVAKGIAWNPGNPLTHDACGSNSVLLVVDGSAALDIIWFEQHKFLAFEQSNLLLGQACKSSVASQWQE